MSQQQALRGRQFSFCRGLTDIRFTHMLKRRSCVVGGRHGGKDRRAVGGKEAGSIEAVRIGLVIGEADAFLVTLANSLYFAVSIAELSSSTA